MSFERERQIERVYENLPPHGKTWAVSDVRVAAALAFAGAIYQGSSARIVDAATKEKAEQESLDLAFRALKMFESKR